MDSPLLIGAVIGGGILIILMLVMGLVITSRREQNLLEDRLTQYLGEPTPIEDREDQRRAISNWVSKRVERTTFGGGIAQNLARADLKFRVGEYMALVFISIAVLGWPGLPSRQRQFHITRNRRDPGLSPAGPVRVPTAGAAPQQV